MKLFLFISYILFLLTFSIFSFVYIDPNFIYMQKIYTGFAYSNYLVTTSIYCLMIIVLFLYFGLMIRLIILKKISLKEVVGLIGITIICLIVSYPAMLSFDIFNYIFTAKVAYFYHENPYIIMPIEFIGDPMLNFTHAANKVALYGPVWLLLTSIPSLIGFSQFLATLYSFKIFIAVFYVGSAYVLWKINHNLISLCLFILNPLVIIETLISGHNDIAMIFFILLTIYSFQNKKPLFGLLFFVLSIGIKYASLALLPVVIILTIAHYRNKNMQWDRIYIFSFWTMFLIFLMSFLREEIYSWYALWFLVFSALLLKKRFIQTLSISFSMTLLLRYVPFMYFGTYLGETQRLKTIITFVPVFIILTCFVFITKLVHKRY